MTNWKTWRTGDFETGPLDKKVPENLKLRKWTFETGMCGD